MLRTRKVTLAITAVLALALIVPNQAFAALTLLSSLSLSGTAGSVAYDSATGRVWIGADSAFGDANHPTAFLYAYNADGTRATEITNAPRTVNLFADASASQMIAVPVQTGSPTLYNSSTYAAVTTYTGPANTVQSSTYNSVTRKLYSPLLIGNTMSVTDIATGTHSTISLPTSVLGAANIDQVSNKIFMYESSSGLPTSKLVVVDGAAGTASTVSFGRTLNGMALAPAAGKVYLTCQPGSYFETYDIATGSVTETTLSGSGYGAMAYMPLIGKVILANYSSGTGRFYPYDVATGTIGAELTAAAGLAPRGINQATNSIYFVNTTTNQLTELDASTGTVTGTYATPFTPRSVTPLGNTGVLLVTSLSTKQSVMLNGGATAGTSGGGSTSGGGTTTPTTSTSVPASSWWSIALLALAGLGALAVRRRKVAATA